MAVGLVSAEVSVRLLSLGDLSSVCVWGPWEEVWAVCSWGSCVAVPGRLLGAHRPGVAAASKKWQESASPNFEYFQLKKIEHPEPRS